MDISQDAPRCCASLMTFCTYISISFLLSQPQFPAMLWLPAAKGPKADAECAIVSKEMAVVIANMIFAENNALVFIFSLLFFGAFQFAAAFCRCCISLQYQEQDEHKMNSDEKKCRRQVKKIPAAYFSAE